MNEENGKISLISLWSAIGGFVIPVVFAIIFAILIDSGVLHGDGLLWLCAFLFVGLQIVALVTGIMGRHTQSGKAGLILSAIGIFVAVLGILFFIPVARTFSPLPGIRVKLPPPGTPQPGIDKTQQLILRIIDPEPGMSYGTMVLNDEVVSMEILLDRFQKATPKQKEMLAIQSGREVPHEQIVEIMDIAKRAGVKNIGFATVAR